MRRAWSLILLALGVFAAAGAILLPEYVYPKLAKVPLDQDSTSVLEGTATKVLAVTPNGAQIRENANLTATGKVTANFHAPEMHEGTDYAVWLLGVKVVDNADNTVVSASQRQVCFNRQTSEGYVPPKGEQNPACRDEDSFVTDVSDDPPEKAGDPPKMVRKNMSQPGIQFKFPFGVEKRDYKVYDDSTQQAVNAKFSGTSTINGVDVYKFVEIVPDTLVGTKKVPGSLVGRTDPSVDAGLYYNGQVTMWVEPVTGIEVKVEQQQHQELRPDNAPPTVVFHGTLTYNAKTIAQMVSQVETNKGKLQFLTTIGPITFGIAGGLMILVGAFLLRRRRAEPVDPPRPRMHAAAGR